MNLKQVNMKRTKQEVKYWVDRMARLFKLEPKQKSVKQRYSTLKLLLQERYSYIKEIPDIEKFLKDAIFLDRKVRWMTEGEENELKETLSEEYIQENLND